MAALSKDTQRMMAALELAENRVEAGEDPQAVRIAFDDTMGAVQVWKVAGGTEMKIQNLADA